MSLPLATRTATPLTNPPSVFGLHPNAEIGYLNVMADTLFGTILKISAGSASAGGSSSMQLRQTVEDVAWIVALSVLGGVCCCSALAFCAVRWLCGEEWAALRDVVRRRNQYMKQSEVLPGALERSDTAVEIEMDQTSAK